MQAAKDWLAVARCLYLRHLFDPPHPRFLSMNTSGETAPKLEPPDDPRMSFGGFVGGRIEANHRNWILTTPSSNPAMLGMFRARDQTPERDMVPWAGEFAGKYLTSAVGGLRISGDEVLLKYLTRFVAELIACQGEDGYLGPWSESRRLSGSNPAQDGKLWDLWGHYHCMLGLFRWHLHTDDAQALAACRKAADMMVDRFLSGNQSVLDAGAEEMNQAVIHIFCLLFKQTGHKPYLDMARQIEQDWQTPPSGDYLRHALKDRPFHEGSKPRWESLHDLQAIAELFFISGDASYSKAYKQIWWSILEGDRHNTGGFSAGEKATGNPYNPEPIETCCTIAWMALTLDYLRMTGDSRAADELELSMFNAVMGAQSPGGHWCTYNTPMDGERRASAHDIVFQARAGSPELNCCSVNGPRGFGILSEWAVMTLQDGFAINFYGPSITTVQSSSGITATFAQETTYPVEGGVRTVVDLEQDHSFRLLVRIPGWSISTNVAVNSEPVSDVKPGTYLEIERLWHSGDVIEIEFDLSPRVWVGEQESEGKMSIYHGPILLAYDMRFDRYEPHNLPTIDIRQMPTDADAPDSGPQPWLLKCFATESGDAIDLCDFATAGAEGDPYVSWLPNSGLQPAAFSGDNPMRLIPNTPR